MGHVTHLEEMKNVYRIFIGKHEEKTASEIQHSLDDNIVIDFKGRVMEGTNWIHLAQNMVQWVAAQDSIKGKGFSDQLSSLQFSNKDCPRWS